MVSDAFSELCEEHCKSDEESNDDAAVGEFKAAGNVHSCNFCEGSTLFSVKKDQQSIISFLKVRVANFEQSSSHANLHGRALYFYFEIDNVKPQTAEKTL